MVLSAFALALALGAQPSTGRAFIDAGEHGAAFSRAVAAEVSGISTSTSASDAAGAEVLVSVRREGGLLALTMRTQRGELLVSRAFDLSGGDAPATRQAVLAVAAAIVLLRERGPAAAPAPSPEADPPRSEEHGQRHRPQPSPETAAQASPRSSSMLSIAAGGAMTTVNGLSGAELGFRIAAERQLGPAAVGIAFELTGLCCEVESAAMSASLRRIDFGLYGRWPLLELGGLSVGPEATLGIGHDRLRARATAFVGQPATEEKSSLRVLGRAGVSLRYEVSADWLLASASAGSDIRAPAISVSLPPGFPNDPGPLDTGVVAAYAQVGLVLRAP